MELILFPFVMSNPVMGKASWVRHTESAQASNFTNLPYNVTTETKHHWKYKNNIKK